MPHEDAVKWEAGLGDPLPGDPLEVAAEAFDDSYEQIHQ
jgi:hypothetical protein